MKRFLACLVLCAWLSASAQDDNCTILGIQDLSGIAYSLQNQIDSLQSQGSIHGHLDIAQGSILEWIVPAGVNLIEVTLTGGSGGTGQGTTNCAYAGGAASGCGGGAGGMGRLFIGVSRGDTIVIQAGATPDTPAPFGSCGVGQTGYDGTPSVFTFNGEIVLTATGGGGGRGVWCACGSSYNNCGQSYPGNNPSLGGLIGPSLDSGAILLESGNGGGGDCLLRY